MSSRGRVNYVCGDATVPLGDSPQMIVHVVNDIGVWGGDLAAALSQRWSQPEAAYRSWHQRRAFPGTDFALGAVQIVRIEEEPESCLWVANLIGRHGIARHGQMDPPVRYDAIATGLDGVAEHCRRLGAQAHMPRIGCGLAGGNWEPIEPLLLAHLVAEGVPVTVYDLP